MALVDDFQNSLSLDGVNEARPQKLFTDYTDFSLKISRSGSVGFKIHLNNFIVGVIYFTMNDNSSVLSDLLFSHSVDNFRADFFTQARKKFITWIKCNLEVEKIRNLPRFKFRLVSGQSISRSLGNILEDVVILSSKDTWLKKYVDDYIFKLFLRGYAISHLVEPQSQGKGDVCFYLGCDVIVQKSFRDQFDFNLVVHESSLPSGRGWSP